MKCFLIIFFGFLINSCSPKVEEIILYKYFINHDRYENEDSTITIHLTVNTYDDFFGGRESIFSFKREFYRLNLLKIDTIYNNEDIMISGYPRHKKRFYKIPLYKGFI